MRPYIILTTVFLLTGCASLSQSKWFRNRALDYTNTTIANQPFPVTPDGLSPPAFHPRLPVPNSPLVFAPEKHPDITPPDFADSIPVAPLPAGAASTHQ